MSSSIKQKTELKAQLFSSIQELGLQDELKKQLRIQICEKLKQRDLIKKPGPQTHEDKLYNRIIASIISEQLRVTDCGYSNSIYVAQSGFDLKILQRSQIIQIMGIAEQDLDSRFSILGNFIKRKYPFNGGTLKSTAIQTNPEDVGYTLEQRLALIDQQYRRNIVNSTQNKEQIEYKNKIVQIESDLKRAYQKDIQRFKQFQAHTIKVTVSQEWRKKFQQYAHSISEQYSRKMQQLRKKQKLLEDNIVNKTKVLDQKTTNTHKNFLQKIQLLQIKSNIATETQRNLQIERKRTKQQYMKLEDELKSKKREYDSLLLNLNDKIAYEVGVAKLAVQQEYQQKNAQFLNRKKFIDEEYGKLMGIKDTTDVIKEESKRLYEENIRLRKDLTELQQELRISASQNSGKGDRLQSLRAELNQMERQKIIRDESLREQIKKCKNRQLEISQLRHQLDQLRQWKEKQEQAKNKNAKRDMQSSLIDEQDYQRARQPPVRKQQKKSEMAQKLQVLKEERKKYIERLKLQI